MTNDTRSPAGSIEVRPATQRDLDAIRDLALRVLPGTYVSTGLLKAAEVEGLIEGYWSREYFSSVLDGGGLLWVADRKGSVIGVAEVARIGDDDAVLWKLYVETELQGLGIGTRLLAGTGSQLWEGTKRWFTEYVTRAPQGSTPSTGRVRS